MRKLTMVIMGVALAGALLMGAAPARAEETATFRFSPLARTVTVTHTTAVTKMDGAEMERSEATEMVRTVARRTATGFTLTETLFSASKTTDGEDDEIDDTTRCFLNVAISVDTDAAGKLLAIRGLDKLSARAKTVFDADAYKIYGPLFAEKALKQVVSDDWQVQYGAMVGKTVKVGDSWKTKGSMPLPDGKSSPVTVTTTVAGFKTVNGKRCVHLVSESDVDLKAVSKALTYVLRTLPRPDGMKPPTVTATRYTRRSERVVDPDTMEDLQERVAEVRESTISVAGQGSFVLTETEDRVSRQEADTVWKAPGLET
ncbi:MAG TPA: hypothetical protein PLZ36_17175 [Armatimonadota bacterium]|nr:hypothetical protein [Armatimonadota bacterium]HOS43642.1 hypothetical protein [Armatimonadota bacterium]